MANYTNAFLEAHKVQLKNEGKITRTTNLGSGKYAPATTFGNYAKNITIFDVLALGELLLDSPNNTGYTGTDTKSVLFSKLQMQQPSPSNSTVIFKRPDSATNTFTLKAYNVTRPGTSTVYNAWGIVTVKVDFDWDAETIAAEAFNSSKPANIGTGEVDIGDYTSVTEAVAAACLDAVSTIPEWNQPNLGALFPNILAGTGYVAVGGTYGTDGAAFKGQAWIADSLYFNASANHGLALCNAEGTVQTTGEAFRACVTEWEAYYNSVEPGLKLDPGKGTYIYRPIIELTDAATMLPMLQTSLQRIRTGLQNISVKVTINPVANGTVTLNQAFMNAIGNPAVHNDGEGNLDFTVVSGRSSVLGALIDRFNSYTVQNDKTTLYTQPKPETETFGYLFKIDGNYFCVQVPKACATPFGETSLQGTITTENYAPQGKAMQAALDGWLALRNLYLISGASANVTVELLDSRDDGAPIWIEEHTVRVQHQGPARLNIAAQVNKSVPVGQSAQVHVKNSMYEVMEGVKPAALININEHVSDDVAFQNLINGKPARLR